MTNNEQALAIIGIENMIPEYRENFYSYLDEYRAKTQVSRIIIFNNEVNWADVEQYAIKNEIPCTVIDDNARYSYSGIKKIVKSASFILIFEKDGSKNCNLAERYSKQLSKPYKLIAAGEWRERRAYNEIAHLSDEEKRVEAEKYVNKFSCSEISIDDFARMYFPTELREYEHELECSGDISKQPLTHLFQMIRYIEFQQNGLLEKVEQYLSGECEFYSKNNPMFTLIQHCPFGNLSYEESELMDFMYIFFDSDAIVYESLLIDLELYSLMVEHYKRGTLLGNLGVVIADNFNNTSIVDKVLGAVYLKAYEGREYDAYELDLNCFMSPQGSMVEKSLRKNLLYSDMHHSWVSNCTIAEMQKEYNFLIAFNDGKDKEIQKVINEAKNNDIPVWEIKEDSDNSDNSDIVDIVDIVDIIKSISKQANEFE